MTYREKAKTNDDPVRPWNSEPPLETLITSFYTPNDEFFVRNHNAVPHLAGDTSFPPTDITAEEDYELEIEECAAVGVKGRSFTLAQLKQLPRVDVIATLQCAGNRQQDFVHGGRPLYVAPHWNNTAIGCAKWTGVRVRDILKACGMDVRN